MHATQDSFALTSCPACKARLRGDEPLEEPCRRCGSDLELARRALASARRLVGVARTHLARGQSEQAVGAARKAMEIVDNEVVRRLLLACLLSHGACGEAVRLFLSGLHENQRRINGGAISSSEQPAMRSGPACGTAEAYRETDADDDSGWDSGGNNSIS